MGSQLTIESPDFDRIRKGDSSATEDAIKLLWFVANEQSRSSRAKDRQIAERLSPKVLSRSPSGNENNVDTEGAGFIVYTGSSAVNITGYRAPSVDGVVLTILVTGSGTITHQNQNASSDAGNRMVFQAGSDKAVATNRVIVLQYYNSRWREWSFA